MAEANAGAVAETKEGTPAKIVVAIWEMLVEGLIADELAHRDLTRGHAKRAAPQDRPFSCSVLRTDQRE